MILQTRSERDLGIERRLGWLFALGGCIVFLDQTIFRLHELPQWAPWWNAGALGLVGILLALAVTGLLLPVSFLRFFWFSIPSIYLVLQFLWPLGYRGTSLAGATPWIWTVEPPIVAMLLLTLRPIAALLSALMLATVPAISSLLFIGFVSRALLEETLIQAANVIYVAIFIGVYFQLRDLRKREMEAKEQRRRQQRAELVSAEHARISRVVHDEVLSAFAAAIQSEGIPTQVLRRAAAQALTALDESLHRPSGANFPMTTEEASLSIISRLRTIDESLDIELEATEGSIQADIAQATERAAAEALRNSIRHAGSAAKRHVEIVLAADRMRVTVSDDGVGFDPLQLSDGMGLTGSITGRMIEIGGSATLVSQPGQGTRVIISWPS